MNYLTIFLSQNSIFTPELILIIGTLILIIFTIFLKEKNSTNTTIFNSLIITISSIYFLIHFPKERLSALNNSFISDGFIVYSKILILISLVFSLLLLIKQKENLTKTYIKPEHPILMMFSTIGMLIMISSSNFLSLYIGLELQTLPLYILTASNRHKLSSAEAGLKYFILGSFTSCLLLFGVSLIYGITGSISFQDLNLFLSSMKESNITDPQYLSLLFALILILTSLLFKISAFPYHILLPNIYQGAPVNIVLFLASAPKITGFVILARVLFEPFGKFHNEWTQILIFIAISSMLVGAFGAIYQNNIKKFIAYSSINNVGFILIGIIARSAYGVQSFLIYLTIYISLTIGLFSFTLIITRLLSSIDTKKQQNKIDEIDSLSGLAKILPGTTILFTIILLSATGIIPFAGFFAKFHILIAAFDQGLYSLAIIGIFSSVISAYYYFRIIKILYLGKIKKPNIVQHTNQIYIARIILFIVAFFNITFFFYHDMIFNIIQQYSKITYW